MAQSVKIDFNIWSQFDHHAYDIIHQDFVHQNLLRVNANILSSKGRIRLQETLLQKKEQFTTTGQTNILFPFNSNKWLYFQCRTKGFRIHFDNGLFPRGHLQHNVYASFQSTRKMTENMFKIGCETVAGNWRYNLRYRYAAQDQSHTLYSKWRYDYHNWTFEGIKALDLNNLILLKNNLLIGYYQGNKTYHLRLEKQGWRTQPIDFKKIRLADLFESATFNFTKTLNANQRVGIETGIKTTGQAQPFSLVWEAYDPILHRTLKLKASSNNSAALSLRNPLGSYGSYILGIGIDNFGSQNNVNFGVLVDLNL